MEENWKAVVGYEGWYSVSDLGRVRRDMGGQQAARPGHILRAGVTRGYAHVVLCRNSKQRSFAVHKLVMAAFVGPRPPGMEINHIDTVKTNNALSNLEYVTPLGNTQHAIRMGLRPPPSFGSANSNAKLTDDDVRQIEAAILQGERQAAIARRYRVSHGAVQGIAHGRTWRHITQQITARACVAPVWRGNAKLTESDVRQIKSDLLAGGGRLTLAMKYGVNKSTIAKIATGKYWQYLSPASASEGVFPYATNALSF